MSKRRSVLESEIQRQIEASIGAEPDVLLLQNSVGLAQHFDDKTGKTWRVPYGLGVGSPDLVSILHFGQCIGTWLCFEVKCPGEDAEPHQAINHDQWRAFGAFVYVVHSPEEARAAVEDARRQVRESLLAWASEGCP